MFKSFAMEKTKQKADWEIAIEKTNAAIEKTDAAIEKTNAGIDKMRVEFREEMAERDKRDKQMREEMAERDKKINARIKKMSSKLEGIGASNGIVAETFFEQATENGITLNIKGKKSVFEQTASNLVICDDFANPKAEIDLFMTNGDYLLLVETKYRLDNKHVEQIPHKIAMLKKHLPKAVAG